MSTTLTKRVSCALNLPVKPEVRAFAERLVTSDALALLFYGSNLRTGSLEGVLDFYVLTTGPLERGIWPRVSYHEWSTGGVDLRAKVATMTLETFAAAAAGKLLDTTIWARFVQPSALVWSKNETSTRAVVGAIGEAACTAARLAVALGPETGTAEAYWKALFRATYAAEFRVERAGREDSILAVNQEHFTGLLPLALTADGIAFDQDQDTICPYLSDSQRQNLHRWWKPRQKLGKPYNLTRLVRASTTFEGAARYAAWKIERHTGVHVPLNPWREKHPILAAPGVLWRVWQAKREQALTQSAHGDSVVADRPGVRTALILAGSRPGAPDPLAVAEHVGHKALIDVGGVTMLARVVAALRAAQIETIAVSANHPEVVTLAQSLGCTVIPTGSGPSASVAKAFQNLGAPLLITTADHALLKPEWVTDFIADTPSNADVSVLLAHRSAVEIALPSSRRTYLKLADGGWSGCNLFLLANARAHAAIETWSQVEADRKRPWKIAGRLGMGTLWRYALGRLTMAQAISGLGSRIGIIAKAIPARDGLAAVDVDKVSDLAQVRALIANP